MDETGPRMLILELQEGEYPKRSGDRSKSPVSTHPLRTLVSGLPPARIGIAIEGHLGGVLEKTRMDDVALMHCEGLFERCFLKISHKSVRAVLGDGVLPEDAHHQATLVGRWARALGALADLSLLRWQSAVSNAPCAEARGNTNQAPVVVFEGASGWNADTDAEGLHALLFHRAVGALTGFRDNWAGVLVQGRSRPLYR